MSDDPKQQLDKTKIIGFRVTEEELQNIIIPTMQDSYQLDLVKHDTISSFVRFCINFWIGHYRLKKQQSGMTQQEIAAQKEQAYEKNSTA
jgi:pectate lyase